MTSLEKAAEDWWVKNKNDIFSRVEAFEAGARWMRDEAANVADEAAKLLKPGYGGISAEILANQIRAIGEEEAK